MITFKEIRKYLTSVRSDKRPAQNILGTQEKVAKFGDFYHEQNEGLMLIGAALIHSFVSSNTFTPEELEAYKKGLSDFGRFFKQAWEERDKFGEKPTKQIQDLL